MSFDVPVLLITWRRPDTTRQVLDAIRLVAPTHVYVASDGPSHPEEEMKVTATRALIEEAIDWPCKVHKRYSVENQGCEKGVSAAITWFFAHVEEGIILEDDCVPHSDFFEYCELLLGKYRYDFRVWSIGGNNFQKDASLGGASYYFSRYNHSWGWATWRRAWAYYSDQYQIWKELESNKSMQVSLFSGAVERRFWMEKWSLIMNHGIPDTWDYRWTMVCMANRGLTALPSKNLVMNIGFGSDATHTKDGLSSAPDFESLFVASHPFLVLNDELADQFTFAHHFRGRDYARSISWTRRIFRRFFLLITRPIHYPRLIFNRLWAGS